MDDRDEIDDFAWLRDPLIALGKTAALTAVFGPAGTAIGVGLHAGEIHLANLAEEAARVDEVVKHAFGDANADPAATLRGFNQVYEENFDPFLYDRDGTRARRILPAHYANTRFAQAKMGMPEELRLGEFQQWMEMAKEVIDRSEGDKAELAKNIIRARSTIGKYREEPPMRDQMVVTDDLDALDRLALVGNDVKTQARIAHHELGITASGMAAAGTHIKVEDDGDSIFDAIEGDLGFVHGVAKTPESVIRARRARHALEIAADKMAAAGTYFRTTDHRGGIFESVEDDLGFMSDTASHAVSAAADPSNPWARYREQGQVPLLNSEGLAYGLWSLEESMARTRDQSTDLQDAADAAGYELWELENPLLRTRDGALGLADAMGDGYGGHGLTSAMNDAGTAADGLALGSGHAEQALLAAGLSGSATTEVLDLMRSAGLDPATTAWGELATAVHVWGDATDTEVSRVIDRLGSLAGAQGGAGSGSAGSGGGSTGVDLGRLMSLAQSVAERRADMGDLNPEHIDHELGKLLGQLGAPGSLEEKLALLQRFFAGSASGIAFGLGPSASSLGFNIPQFASGGTVPGPLGAPQLIVAHGGEHIVPHRATGSPTIIRIELDREVLAQAVLGDLLRLQGREVTLGLS